jgi:type I restriction enzyme S subunit
MSREWQRLMAGSVLPDIYMGTFKALQILLPPLAEQKQISAIGAAFDRRLENERDTLAILIETRAALAQELLSGRLRLPESIVARHRNIPAAAA